MVLSPEEPLTVMVPAWRGDAAPVMALKLSMGTAKKWYPVTSTEWYALVEVNMYRLGVVLVAVLQSGCAQDPASVRKSRQIVDLQAESDAPSALDDSTKPPAEEDPTSCVDHPPLVVVGDGVDEFHPLGDHDPVTMIHGPQGGWHIAGSVHVENTDPVVDVHFSIVEAHSGLLVSNNTYRVMLEPRGACAGEFMGMYGYLFVYEMIDGLRDTPPELLADHELVMLMEVSDASGRHGEASMVVVAAMDPADIGDTGLEPMEGEH